MIKTLVLMFIAISAGSVGHVLLRAGMKAIGEFPLSQPALWLPFFGEVIVNFHIILGVFCQAIFFGLWLIILSGAELSFALPLTASEYLLAAAFSYYFLAEKISFLRLSGTILICIGIALICLDEAHKNSGSGLF